MNTSTGQKPIRSIRFYIAFTLVGLVTLAILVISAISIISIRDRERAIRQISSQALQEQAESYLIQQNDTKVNETDLILDQVRQDAEKLAAYTATLFDHPEAFQVKTYWTAGAHLSLGPQGQYTNGKGDVSSVFLPNNSVLNDQTRQDIETSAYLDFLFVPIFNNNPNIEAAYFATPHDVVRYYPNINLGEKLPPDFRATQRAWYTGSLLDKDPQKTPWWTPLTASAVGSDMVTTVAVPVYSDNQDLIGVIGLDVNLKNVKDNIGSDNLLGSGYSFLIDTTGKAITLPEQGALDILGKTIQPGETGLSLNNSSTPFSAVIANMRSGKKGFRNLEINNQELFVAYSPLKTNGWSLGSVVNSTEILQAVNGIDPSGFPYPLPPTIIPIIITAVAILLLTSIFSWVIASRITSPIRKLTIATQRMSAGQQNVEFPPNKKDEIGILAHQISTITSQYHNQVAQLEEQVAEKKDEVERASAKWQTVAEVAREINMDESLNSMLTRAVNLIHELFDYYHIGIFVINWQAEYAVLKAVASKAEQKILDQNRKVKLDDTTIIGYVANRGEAASASDASWNTTFRSTFLPDAHSEIALPLKYKERVIGVLDVQSIEANPFDPEDIQILQIMADLLTPAIQNTHLLDNLSVFQVSQSEYTQASWRRLLQQRGEKVGYRLDGGTLEDEHNLTPEMMKAIQNKQPVILEADHRSPESKLSELSIPLIIRDQSIGALDIKFESETIPPEVVSSFEEIASRLSIALESSRLLEEAQLRTEQLHLLQDITAAAASHLDMAELLQEVTQMIHQGYQSNGCRVFFFDSELNFATLVSEARLESQDQPVLHTGLQIPIAESKILQEMIASETTCLWYDFKSLVDAKALQELVPPNQPLTLILCPLTSHGHKTGIILLEIEDTKRRFNREDLQLLDQIGLQISVAMDVIRLFDQTRLRAEQERMVADISARIRASTNVDVILQTSIKELARALHLKKGSIQLRGMSEEKK